MEYKKYIKNILGLSLLFVSMNVLAAYAANTGTTNSATTGTVVNTNTNTNINSGVWTTGGATIMDIYNSGVYNVNATTGDVNTSIIFPALTNCQASNTASTADLGVLSQQLENKFGQFFAQETPTNGVKDVKSKFYALLYTSTVCDYSIGQQKLQNTIIGQERDTYKSEVQSLNDILLNRGYLNALYDARDCYTDVNNRLIKQNNSWNMVGILYSGCTIEGLSNLYLGVVKYNPKTSQWIKTGKLEIGDAVWIYYRDPKAK